MNRNDTQRMTNTLLEVGYERLRQELKWGQQNHPDLPPDAPENVLPSTWLYVPTADDARAMCQGAFAQHRGSYAHILLEEVCEAFDDARDPHKLRAELVQVAAVAVAWIEKIDRHDPHAELRRRERNGWAIEANRGTVEEPKWERIEGPAKFTCEAHLYRAVPTAKSIDAAAASRTFLPSD
jgi:hypothetical protein